MCVSNEGRCPYVSGVMKYMRNTQLNINQQMKHNPRRLVATFMTLSASFNISSAVGQPCCDELLFYPLTQLKASRDAGSVDFSALFASAS